MNFRELVAALDAQGELLRIRKSVNTEYELSALLAQAEDLGKACCFEQVEDCTFPAVGSVMTTHARWAQALGLPADHFAAPQALESHIEAAVNAPLPAIDASSAPVMEHVQDDQEIDLSRLPVPRFFDGDSHRFMTAVLGFATDPETGLQNVGFYRVPVIDGQRISVSAGPTSDLRRIYNLHKEQGKPLRMAIAVGVAPAVLIAAAADLPAGLADLDVAGALQNKPVELVSCRTCDVKVPADCEMVLEVTVDLDDWVDNTMGEFGDQYGQTASPVATVNAMSWRNDAQFHVIQAGMGREHNLLGSLMGYRLRLSMLEALQADYAGVRDVCVDLTPRRTGMRGQVTIAIDKQDDAVPRQIIADVDGMRFGRFPLAMLMQRIVVVDDDVDILNVEDIEWAIASRVVAAGQFNVKEDKTGRGATVTRLGIDATAPLALKHALRRPQIQQADRYVLKDYLGG